FYFLKGIKRSRVAKTTIPQNQTVRYQGDALAWANGRAFGPSLEAVDTQFLEIQPRRVLRPDANGLQPIDLSRPGCTAMNGGFCSIVGASAAIVAGVVACKVSSRVGNRESQADGFAVARWMVGPRMGGLHHHSAVVSYRRRQSR